MRILVTGGAGYIGCSLVDALEQIENVEEIIVYDNLLQNNYNFFFNLKKNHKVRFVNGDILDTYKLEKIIDQIDVIYHLAAYVSFPYNYSQNLQYEQVNRWGTLGLTRLILNAERTIKKIVYISSSSVYGFGNELDSSDKHNPSNAYGQSKFDGEQYINLLSKTCAVDIIRSANVFGFNRMVRLDGVINAFVFNSLVNNEIKIYGSGKQSRAFISMDSLIDALIDSIKDYKSKGVIFKAEFNASMNELKNWLLNMNPNLTYTYLNQNQDFLGQSFSELPTINPKLLKDCYANFKSNISVLQL